MPFDRLMQVICDLTNVFIRAVADSNGDEAQPARPPIPRMMIIKRVQEYVDGAGSQPPPVAELARSAGVSERSLRRRSPAVILPTDRMSS